MRRLLVLLGLFGLALPSACGSAAGALGEVGTYEGDSGPIVESPGDDAGARADSDSGGELMIAPNGASEGGVVLADAGDGGAPSVATLQEVCNQRWNVDVLVDDTTQSGASSLGNVATDAAGNLIVTSALDVSGQNAGVITKLDSDCRNVWTRQYTASLLGNVFPLALAVDTAGNIVVGGTFAGNVDFGKGTLAGSARDSAFVVKVDPNGNTLWANAYSSNVQSDQVESVAIDGSGAVDVTLTAGSDTDFGGGALGGVDQDEAYVVQLNADGTYAFGRALDHLYGPSVATNASRSIWISGFGDGAVNWGGTGSTTVTGTNGVVAELDPGGHYVWGTVIPTGEQQRTGAAVGASGAAVMTFGESDSIGSTSLISDGGTDGGATVTWSRTIAKVSFSGQPLWSDATDYAHEVDGYEEDTAGAKWVVLDAAEDILVGGNFNGALHLGSTTLQSAGGLDTYVQVRDPSGHLKAGGRWGGTGTDSLTSLAVDANGNAILLGFSGPPPGSSSSTSTQFFVAKLGM